MAATKKARVERSMVMAMRMVGNEEGKADNEKDGVGGESGVQRRGQWRQLSDGNKGDG